MQFNIKLTEMYWLNWHYSLTDNFDSFYLCLVNLFYNFLIESESDALVLHLIDGFGSFGMSEQQIFYFWPQWINIPGVVLTISDSQTHTYTILTASSQLSLG